MAVRFSKKWLWALTVVPVAAGIMLLARGCDSDIENIDDNQNADRVAFVVDSLLKENRKLTDSLAVVNHRLDDCEQARAAEKKCPCQSKKPVTKKPIVKKSEPVKSEPVVQPSVRVVVKDNAQNNGAVVVGSNNNVTNVVVNNYTQAAVDTVKQVQRTRRVLVGCASLQHRYTK